MQVETGRLKVFAYQTFLRIVPSNQIAYQFLETRKIRILIRWLHDHVPYLDVFICSTSIARLSVSAHTDAKAAERYACAAASMGVASELKFLRETRCLDSIQRGATSRSSFGRPITNPATTTPR